MPSQFSLGKLPKYLPFWTLLGTRIFEGHGLLLHLVFLSGRVSIAVTAADFKEAHLVSVGSLFLKSCRGDLSIGESETPCHTLSSELRFHKLTS